MLDRATVPVTVPPGDQPAGEDVLYRLQVAARSWLGAFALHTGAVLVDHGLLRMLGGGTIDLPDLAPPASSSAHSTSSAAASPSSASKQ